MNKKTNSYRGLRGRVLGITIFTTFLSFSILLGFGLISVKQFIDKQMEGELIQQTDFIENMLLASDTGDYKAFLDEAGVPHLYKGNTDLGAQYLIWDTMSEKLGMEITFFYQDLRIITTLKSPEGMRLTGTSASPIITRDVLHTGKSKFYNDADVLGEKRYVYYRPIVDSSGELFGMLAVSKSAQLIQAGADKWLMPLMLLSVLIIILLSFFSIFFTNRLIQQIDQVETFMKSVTNGNLSVSMGAELLNSPHELGSLARCCVSMQKSLRTLVEKDALTGLDNRRSVSAKLKQIRSRFLDAGVPYSICICDIDHFKRVNDTYGHDNGDVVLRAISKLLQENMLGNGFAARWGGEEFLLLFDRGSFEKNTAVVESILQKIRDLIIPLENVEEDSLSVTMSFGIQAALPETSNDEIIRLADEKLYYAKTHGRNQLITQLPAK